jgi:hypothetical protein
MDREAGHFCKKGRKWTVGPVGANTVTGCSLLPKGVGGARARDAFEGPAGTSTERLLNLLGNLESLATVLEALRNSLGAEL